MWYGMFPCSSDLWAFAVGGDGSLQARGDPVLQLKEAFRGDHIMGCVEGCGHTRGTRTRAAGPIAR